MKKIGILTFPNSPSFGASLQMFALYQVLNDLGNQAEIINYINRYMKSQKHVSHGFIQNLKGKVSNVLNFHGRKEFKSFERKLKFYPAKPIYHKEKLKDLTSRYDYIVCGSDQVWNPYVTGADSSYLLDFCDDDSKKIAYAPSFGVLDLEDEFYMKYSGELKKFHALSVREDEGRKIVEKLIKQKCPVVLDPSMLLTKEKWEEQLKIVKKLPKHYIVRFVFNQNSMVDEFLDKLSQRTGLPVITLGGTLLSCLKRGDYTGPIGPQEWLYTIANADYIVTDSFHGTAFSIIFEKEFYISLASSTNSRLVTLAKTFQLEDRIIAEELKKEQRIDYSKVRTILENKRSESLEYLKMSIN